jgi:predicted negative regulator of RcsB-dependent stress response
MLTINQVNGVVLFASVIMLASGFYFGYKFPREVELESTAPVEFHYEVTPEAARLLALKYVEGCK